MESNGALSAWFCIHDFETAANADNQSLRGDFEDINGGELGVYWKGDESN